MKKHEREHLEKVAQQPCMVCGAWPVQVHHIETGMGRKKDHLRVISLCYRHHQGEDGLHTIGRKAWVQRYGREVDLMAKMLERMSE